MPTGSIRGRYFFDRGEANRWCRFIEGHLRLTEGEKRGRRFKLQRWQRRIVRRVFGWRRRADGTRRYRRVWLELPRKNGKSEFAAALALALLVLDGEGGAQVYTCAIDKDQAKIVFDKAAVMAASSETVSRKVEVLKTSVYFSRLNGRLMPLSSVVATKHGLSPSAAVYDEVHEMPDGQLIDVVHKGTGARAQPLEIYITTAGLTGQGIAWEMHQYALDVLAGRVVDEELLVMIFAAGEKDDWRDPAVWAKANPSLNVSLKIGYLESECRLAQRSPRAENDFRRFHLNQWTSQAVRWLPMADWDLCSERPGDPGYWQDLRAAMRDGAFRDRRAYAGLDLAKSRDMTALVWYLPADRAGERSILIPRFWLPEEAMTTVSTVQARMYQDWERSGALLFTRGRVTDYDFLIEEIFADVEVVRLQLLGYDPYNAEDLSRRLQDEGVPVMEVRQGIRTMAPPSKDLERRVVGHMLEHGNHPVLRWMADNVTVETDVNNNIMPRKGKNAQKIDGITASILALCAEVAAPGPKTISYEAGGIYA